MKSLILLLQLVIPFFYKGKPPPNSLLFSLSPEPEVTAQIKGQKDPAEQGVWMPKEQGPSIFVLFLFY